MEHSLEPDTSSSTFEHFKHIRSAVVGIITAVDQFVRPIGMGLLLEIADASFVITAKHVAEEARETGNSGCTGPDNRGVSFDGKWILSHDWPDIAIHQLSAKAAAALRGKRFARLSDFVNKLPSSQMRYSILGCPQVWSKGAQVPQRGQFGEIQLITQEYRGVTTGLDKFDSSIHFLLRASPPGITQNGEPWIFKTENGFALDFPGDLKGISGSPVWSFVGPDGGATPQFTGIQTAVYHKSGLIKATKSQFVLDFVSERFPGLRPAIDLSR